MENNQDGLVLLHDEDLRLGGHGLFRPSEKAAASVVPSRLSSHRHDFRYLGSHQIFAWRSHYLFRYYQFLRSRGDVHPLFGHLATNKQTLVEEIRDAAAAHSVLRDNGSLYTVGLDGGLRLPEVDRGGDDPSESVHDHDVRRLLLQGVYQETKEQHKRRDLVESCERKIQEPIATCATFHALGNALSCATSIL
ncbi:hypothetical protein K0M31_020380 [Melipona bicolor]|uniref:Uncharacterized protein n=1 Tax=Melipona bicolor TaxID=60889 RepID=A0AA40KQP4_9HYME|nr:hypothetical protein K0M31_020380 [Melipona bicolor]